MILSFGLHILKLTKKSRNKVLEANIRENLLGAYRDKVELQECS